MEGSEAMKKSGGTNPMPDNNKGKESTSHLPNHKIERKIIHLRRNGFNPSWRYFNLAGVLMVNCIGKCG